MADEPLGRMVIELGLDHAAFGKGLTGAKREVKYAMADMKSSMAVLGQSGKQFDILSAKSKGLSQVMMSQQRVVEQLGKAYKNSLVDGNPSKQTAKLGTDLQNANAKLAALQTQYKNNAAAMAKARVEQTGFTGGLNKVSKAAVSTGTAMSNIGSNMTHKVSAPIAAGLAIATKSAISFDSQIKSIGPLLTNGGAITAKFRKQLDQLGDASKSMSMKYGVSTTEINNGMSELVRRGYTTKQVLGSMPAIMDATAASGEDMGTVMNTVSSTVEQFGLKTNSTAGTMKNTQMVTDSLTYAANATAAGFSDMGEAMSYVGPQAKAAGMSVQQTAAAIGELSNKGIEGQKAGTNLRGILTSLVKVTPNASKAFRSMGISASELKKDSNDLPRLIDDITKGTKGWDNADRNKAISTAFGRENQSAMNALLEGGSKQLRQLTKDTEKATGSTKSQADLMRKTAASNVKQMVASLQVLGIEVGEKLLPKLTPLIQKATEIVKGFSKMDDATQNTIIKFALLAAAAGPVLSVVGKLTKGFGTFGGGIVAVVSKIAQWHAKNQAVKESVAMLSGATETAGRHFKSLKGDVDTVNGSATTAKTTFGLLKGAFTTAEAGAGVLGTSLSVTGAAITGVGLAAVAGAAYWELYGKKASESQGRVDKWGSDIGTVADKSATKMQDFEQKASTALDDFGGSAKKNAQIVNDAFSSMTSQTSKDSSAQLENTKKLADQVGGSAGQAMLKKAQAQYDSNQSYIKDMKAMTKQVSQIQSDASKNDVKLTSDQRTVIANLQRQMAQDEINTLHVKSSQKKLILAAELGDLTSMTKAQQRTATKAVASGIDAENEAYDKQTGKIAQAYKDRKISSDTYHAGMQSAEKDHNSKMTQLGEDFIRTEKAQGKSQSQIAEDLHKVYDNDAWVNSVMAKYKKIGDQTANAAIEITGKMSRATQVAAESWNKMVLDPKTGKLKTNAQSEVNKAAKSVDEWNQMKMLVKKGDMSTNAAAMVGVAAVQTKRWDGLTLKEKKAMIRSKGGDDLAKLLQNGKQWGKLTMAEKKAIITAKGNDDLLAAVSNSKIWNKLTLKEKQAVLKDNASSEMKKAKLSLDDWNALSPKNKKLMASSNTNVAVAKGIKDVGQWNDLPTSVKTLLANDAQARPVLDRAKIKYQQYRDLPASSTKNLLAKDGASKNADKARISVGKYGQMKMPNPIGLKATDKASGPAKSAKGAVDKYAKTPSPGVKLARAKDNASAEMNLARGSVTKFKNTSPGGAKVAKGSDQASSPMTIALSATNSWRKGSAGGTKTAKGSDQASSPFKTAYNAVKAFMNLPSTITKTAISVVKKVTGHEAGTNYHTGGPMLVNDQAGPVFRELVKFPGQAPFIPSGRNVYFDDAPAGTIVAPAGLTARMYKIPQFANGTIPENSTMVEASRVINDSIMQDVRPVVSTSTDTKQDANRDQVPNVLIGQLLAVNNAILQAIKDQGTFDVKGLYKRQAKDLSMSQYGGLS